MFATAAATAAWHAHAHVRHELPSKSPLVVSTDAAAITGTGTSAGIRAPTDAFEGIEEHEPPPPVTPVWDMDGYVQLESPQIENLTISPAQLSNQSATQHHNINPLHHPLAPWTPAELQATMQATATTTTTTTTCSSSSSNGTNPGGGCGGDTWFWDLSPASSPGQSVFPSTTDLTSSTARSSAVFEHTFSLSPLAHQFGSLPSSEPSQDNVIVNNSANNSNNAYANTIVYAHNPGHTSPHQLLLPSHFLYGPSATEPLLAWPPASLSHNLSISAQHDIPVPGPTPSAAIPIPAAPTLHCRHHLPFTTDFSFSQAPASPRSHFDSSSPPRSLIGFLNEQYGPATVGEPVMTQQSLAPATMSLPNASELAAHMNNHFHGTTASSGSPLPPDGGPVGSAPLQGWRASRRDKSLPPPISRNSTITQKSLPAALRSPVPLASSGTIHSQSPFTSPQLAIRSPIFPVNSNSSPQPPPLLFVNQTAQFSTAAGSPTSQGEGGGLGFATFEEHGYSSTSLLPIGRGQKKRKRLPISEEFEEDSEDRKISDVVPTKSELRPPKQAPSMWQVFFADWLARHKNHSPHDKLNVAQAAKEAGVEYKNLSAEERGDLNRRVQLEKGDRERRLHAWQKTLTPSDIKRENKFRAAQRKAGLSRRANIKDPNAPKKPLSAYFMFLAAIRSDPNLVKEVFGDEQETTRQSVLAAKRWRDMSDEEKRPFLTKAEHDKLQYEAARKVYEDRANVMTGTGYIIPDNEFIPDVAAAIFAARPSNRDTSAALPMAAHKSTIRPRSTARYDPVFTSRHTTAIHLSTRRRKFSKRGVSSQDENEHGTSSGLGSGEDSQESDEEWVPSGNR